MSREFGSNSCQVAYPKPVGMVGMPLFLYRYLGENSHKKSCHILHIKFPIPTEKLSFLHYCCSLKFMTKHKNIGMT